MMKSSRWFPYSESQGWDNGSLETDDNGWPTSVGKDTTLIKEFYRAINGQYPSGTYVVLWDGADLGFEVGDDASDARCDDGSSLTNCATKRALFEVDTPSSEGFNFELGTDGMSTSHYMRNIRIIVPGGICGSSQTELDYKSSCETSRGGTGSFGSGQTFFDFEDVYYNRFADNVAEMQNPKVLFHPLSLRRLSPYSTLRVMEPLAINFGNEVVSWNDRGQLAADTIGKDEGASPEVLIALANTLSSDIWINIPHQADDGYVRSFAELALSQLKTDWNVYLEYTNEHWNPSPEYPQSDYMLSRAIELGLGEGDTVRNRGGLFFAQRSTEIFKIWRDVFSASPDRVQRVLGTFIADSALTELMLNHNDTADNVDHIAIGYYIGLYLILDHLDQITPWGLDQFFSEPWSFKTPILTPTLKHEQSLSLFAITRGGGKSTGNVLNLLF